ncbi:MAG TPA: OmpH family outer membrane protein [Chitinophagaceae bacterium]|nr:OmpH family outer membrane protein [Chitinophagaceae bacterium]
MKNAFIGLNVLLFIGVGILFYWHFHPSANTQHSPGYYTRRDSAILNTSGFKIAYVNLDSLEANYAFFRRSSAAFNKKQATMEAELTGDDRALQMEEARLQQKASTMTQAEGEAAQKEVIQRQQQLQIKEQNMRQELLNEQAIFQDNLQRRLDRFLNKYNADRKFAYILSYSKGLNVMLYKDSTFDITKDVVAGLNADSTNAPKR